MHDSFFEEDVEMSFEIERLGRKTYPLLVLVSFYSRPTVVRALRTH